MKVKIEIESENDIQSATLNFKYAKNKVEVVTLTPEDSNRGLLKKAESVRKKSSPLPEPPKEFTDFSV